MKTIQEIILILYSLILLAGLGMPIEKDSPQLSCVAWNNPTR
jgi:hypothetical protein